MRIKGIIYAAVICTFFIHGDYAIGGPYSEIKFREFSRDRDIFERYTDEADSSTSAGDWQRILDSGKEEMTATWERNALSECDRYIREGYDPEEVRQGMDEARAAWENEFDDALLFEKGSWRAQQGMPGHTAGTMTGLKNRVDEAGSADLDDTAAWDSYVAGAVQDTESSWEGLYAPGLANLYAQAEPLAGMEKEGFLAEIVKIEAELRQGFNMEKDTILYLGQSGFIEQKAAGSKTLREESEEKSATVITDNIIAYTESQIRAGKEKILEREYSPGKVNSVNFSGIGDNWQDDLKKLIDYGMSKWEAARERLYNEIISWNRTASGVYDAAEAKWREGLRKLEAARLEWEKQLTSEIYDGLAKWESGSDELQGNIRQSREEFAEYMESMSSQWSGSNHDLVDMAVNGSAVYADAADNIKWLREMIAKNKADMFAVSEYNDAFKAVIGSDMADAIDASAASNADYDSRVEVRVVPTGSPVYSDETRSVTETYAIKVIRYDRVIKSFQPVRFREDPVTVLTMTWNNVVTIDSPAELRSSYSYYLLELGRWQRIQESFRNIASDAEYYMHNRNMIGEGNGAGFLTNTPSADAVDPYLMTGAEYNLELARRDRDFWQGRLDIARAVLDYAEGRTDGSAAATEQNMRDAETAMNESKAAYDQALEAVNGIVEELKAIQGTGVTPPPTDSILALTDRYNAASGRLKEVEADYIECKTRIILRNNGESPEYITKQIIEIERQLLLAEQQVNRSREEYFKEQSEAEVADRTASYAVLYNDAVMGYEQAKDRVSLVKGIVEGGEDGSTCAAWAESILVNKEAIWGADPAGAAAELETLRNAYSESQESNADHNLKRDQLLGCIRNIYFMLQADVDLKKNVIETLRDDEFVPDDFLGTEFIADHELYAEYASYSQQAMELIDDCFSRVDDVNGARTYESVHAELVSSMNGLRYDYGADNRVYIIHNTALKHFEEGYRGLSEQTWDTYRSRVESEAQAAETAADAHEEMAAGNAGWNLSRMEFQASNGDMDAVVWLREYYVNGSAIPGLEYIKAYDARADIAGYVNGALKEYVEENSTILYSREAEERGTDYISQIYSYIRGAVRPGEGGGDNLLSLDAFRGMNAEEISTAAGMLKSYVDGLDSRGIAVPETIRNAAEIISAIKDELDIKLYILSYVTDLVSGTPAELLDDAYAKAGYITEVQDFISTCGSIISDSESGLSDTDRARLIIEASGRLDAGQRKYMEDSGNAQLSGMDEFMTSLAGESYKAKLAAYEKNYADSISSMTPEQAALSWNIPADMRASFIANMKPVYERLQYDIALSEGRITVINAYIASRNLDDDTAEFLTNYALIKEYLGAPVKRPFSEQPFEVKVYLAEKYYYDNVFVSNSHVTDIEGLLEDAFGRGSIDGDIVSEVEEYVGRLNAALFYTGGIDEYIAGLDPAAAEYFQMYIYGSGSALLPGFEYGIYRGADDPLYTAKVTLCRETLGRRLDALASDYYVMMETLDEDSSAAEKEVRKAAALKSFMESGVQERNWRGSAISIIDRERDENGNETDIMVMEAAPLTGNDYIDEYDPVTGQRSVLKISGQAAGSGNRVYDINGIIDDVNRIASVFAALGASGGRSVSSENTIEAFLNSAEPVYNFGDDYAPGADGKYSFEDTMTALVSSAYAAGLDAQAGADDSKSSLDSVEAGINSGAESIVMKKRILEGMDNTSTGELMTQLDTLKREQEAAKQNFLDAGEALDAGRARYDEVNRRYTEAMQDINRAYLAYKEDEFNYERYYSVWEYANTPYLKESENLDSGLGSAAAVDGSGNTNYDELDPPDAKENYERILARYNQAQAVFDARRQDVATQDTIEKVNADVNYAGYKDDFVDASESYIRVSQTCAVLGENVAVLEKDYTGKKKAYEDAKSGIPFFNELEESLKTTENTRTRDLVLSHLKTEADMKQFLHGILWYSCANVLPGIDKEVPDAFGKMHENPEYKYIKDEAAKFTKLPETIKQDIITLYEGGVFGGGATLTAIKNYYHDWAYEDGMYQHYKHRYNSTSWWRFITRRRLKGYRDRWDNKQRGTKTKYNEKYHNLFKAVQLYYNTRSSFAEAGKKYMAATSLKTIEEVKAYLGEAGIYRLEAGDMDALYDTVTAKANPQEQGINLDGIRKEKQRFDMDGLAVQARYRGDTGWVEVLDKDGNVTETYSAGVPYIVLKKNGVRAAEPENGATYDLYDNNYNINEVAGVIKSYYDSQRGTFRDGLMGYVLESSASGGRDYTVMLRDLESTYNSLKDTAAHFNETLNGRTNEIRQRAFDGYTAVMGEFAYNADNSSVHQLIIKEYIRQNTLYQEQLWHQQQEKYSLREKRWQEVTGYIINRGMRDWRQKGNEYLQKWRKWRIEAQKQIESGKQWWTDRDIEMKQEIKSWSDETSKASSKEAARKIYEDLQNTVDNYEKKIVARMPGTSGIAIDTESILSDTMRNIPVSSIGILQNSMFRTDRVAGMAEIFGFGGNTALFVRNQQWQKEYEEAFSVMRNLQVLDVLNGIIDSFNSQLSGANRNVYDGVKWNLRYSDPFYEADFDRHEAENIWSIRVCVESSLTGDKFKIRKFRDYTGMKNESVILSPVKGLNGEIDFTDADTYVNLDGDELDVYVGLESSRLNDEIENVFAEGGAFKTHVDNEYRRLGKAFGKYYGQWAEGEAMLNAGFYAKPIFPNGPNIMNVGVMAAGIAGGPWSGFAAQILMTGVQVADGSMSWQQAVFQVGTSAITAGITVGAKELGTLAGGPLLGAVVENTTRTLGGTLVSCIQYDPEHGLGWDGDRMGSWKTWAGAGVTAAAGSIAGGIKMSGLSSSLVTGLGSSVSQGVTTGDWKGCFGKGVTGAVSSYAGGLISGGISDSLGVTNDSYTTTLINNYTTYGIGRLLGSGEEFDMNKIGDVDAINLVVQDMYQWYLKNRSAMQRGANNAADPAGMDRTAQPVSSSTGDPFSDLDIALSGIFTSLGRGLGQTMADIGGAIKDGAVEAWTGINAGVAAAIQGAKDFTDSTGNWLKYGRFGTGGNPEVIDARIAYYMAEAGVKMRYDTAYEYLGMMVKGRDGMMYKVTREGLEPQDYMEMLGVRDAENVNGIQVDDNRSKEIADLEAKAKKLEKKNPDEARWLRAQAEMLKDGIEVNTGSVDTSNALQGGSLRYYEMKHYMEASTSEHQNICVDNIEKIKRYKEIFGQDPSRFEFYYQNDPDILTDPARLRQDGGLGPVNSIFREALLNLKMNPDLTYEGDLNKTWLKNKFEKTSEYLQDYDIDNIDSLVQGMTKGTCKIESEWAYAVATGKYNGDLNDFYEEGYREGRFGMMNGSGVPSYQWVNETAYFNNKPLLSGPGLNDEKVNKMVDDNGGSDWGVININRYGGESDHRTLVHRENGVWLSYEHDDKKNSKGKYSWRKERVRWDRVKSFHQ